MHCRRALHVPFWPLASSPPAPETPSSSSGAGAASTSQQSFFPSSAFPPPSQPPEVDTWQNTVPANISSLTFPGSTGSGSALHSRHSSKVAAAVLIPLLALAVLAAGAAFFLHRRRSRLSSSKDDARSDAQRLFPVGSAASDGGVVPQPALHGSSDSPYVDTRRSGVGSSDRRFWSPELRPLPPLPRQFGQGSWSEEPADSSEQDLIYSPRVSSVWKGSSWRMESARTSSSRRTFPAVVERCESRGSTLSTPPYPASPVASSARFGSSPAHSGRKSLKTTSETTLAGDRGFTLPPPPPPPARSMSTVTIGGSPHGPRAPQQPSPPPPPPLPPVGFWESQVRRPKVPQASSLYPAGADPKETSDAIKKNGNAALPKLKPLHWDKLQASSDRAMVWDQLRSSSYRVNEEMIETLFVCNPNTCTSQRETDKVQVLPRPAQEGGVLDPKKSQNISILMKALNVTKEEICEALLEGDAESLGSQVLETLLKMAPNREEERKLKELREGDSPFKLGPAEKFLRSLMDVPFWFKRVEAMLYVANFDSEINFLKKSFDTLEEACEELRSSRLFLKLLEAVLKTGNRMNVGTNRGDAQAFKLDTLLKLVNVKGTDGKTTLLHFVTQEIIRSEGCSSLTAISELSAKTPADHLRDELECRKIGLQVVAGIGSELSQVRKAAVMDYNTLGNSVSKLAGGIGRIDEVLRLNEALDSKEFNKRFQETMERFLRRAEDGIIRLQAQESVALSLVKETTEYFHGDSAKEEAHPFRIFMVVSDFLAIHEKICKEIGRINEQTIVSSAQHFPVPVNPTLSPLFSRFHPLRSLSSDEESSLPL